MSRVHNVTTNGTVNLSSQAIAIVCIGAGGGAASGNAGSGSEFGGYGGGGGGMSLLFAPAPAALTCTVGVGGAGGAGITYAGANIRGNSGSIGGSTSCELLSAEGGNVSDQQDSSSFTPQGGAGLQVTGGVGAVRHNGANNRTPAASLFGPSGGGSGTGLTGGGAEQIASANTSGGLVTVQAIQVAGANAIAAPGPNGADCLYVHGPGSGAGGGGCRDTVGSTGTGGTGGAYGGGGSGSGSVDNTTGASTGNGGAGGPGLLQIFEL